MHPVRGVFCVVDCDFDIDVGGGSAQHLVGGPGFGPGHRLFARDLGPDDREAAAANRAVGLRVKPRGDRSKENLPHALGDGVGSSRAVRGCVAIFRDKLAEVGAGPNDRVFEIDCFGVGCPGAGRDRVLDEIGCRAPVLVGFSQKPLGFGAVW